MGRRGYVSLAVIGGSVVRVVLSEFVFMCC